MKFSLVSISKYPKFKHSKKTAAIKSYSSSNREIIVNLREVLNISSFGRHVSLIEAFF